jgi:hypothetical protein
MDNIKKFYRDILGIDLSNLSHPISKRISSLTNLPEGNREINEHHLMDLGAALFDIKRHSEVIYNGYLKKIIKNSDISVHGHIFEIKQCAHFIETSKIENLKFTFGDANKNEPDFIVSNSGFEITSVRFAETATNINPGNKLLGTFRKKNTKGYANNNTALLIDISELTYQTIQNGKIVNTSLINIRKKIRSEMKFGCVLIFIEIVKVVDGEKYFSGTVFCDYSEDCSSELRDLIDNKFIKGQTSNLDKESVIASTL